VLPTPPQGRGEHVLYLDDEASLAEVGARRLESLGYQVTSVTNGRTALALLEKDPAGFDLLITDFTMPLLTGLDVAIEAIRLAPALGVIVLSGHTDGLPIQALERAGVHRVLQKPVSRDELSAAVRQVLDKIGRAG